MSTRSGPGSSGQRRAMEFLDQAKRRLNDATAAGDQGAKIVLERVCETLDQPREDVVLQPTRSAAPRMNDSRLH